MFVACLSCVFVILCCSFHPWFFLELLFTYPSPGLIPQAQYVPEHGTVYLSSYERLPFHANKTDEHGNTMLSLAAQNGNAKIVKYLLAKGANPNHQNHQGQTAAHFAIAYQFFDLSTWLFENGADDTLENKYGLSAYDGLSNEGAGEDDGGGGNALVEYN